MKLLDNVNKSLKEIQESDNVSNRKKFKVLRNICELLKKDLMKSDIKNIYYYGNKIPIKDIHYSDKKIFIKITNEFFTSIMISYGLLDDKNKIEITLCDNILGMDNVKITNYHSSTYGDILVSIRNIIEIYTILLRNKFYKNYELIKKI